jgi:hypothetical protein
MCVVETTAYHRDGLVIEVKQGQNHSLAWAVVTKDETFIHELSVKVLEQWLAPPT